MMAKDYSRLKNIKNIDLDYINEKEIEIKYSEFLDWLKDDIENKEYIPHNRHIIPKSFIGTLFHSQNTQTDIVKYLSLLKINVFYQNKEIYYSFSVTNHDYYFHKNILKIPQLEQKISLLEQTNQDILKKLEEQIQLNSKLCERIFEMKEEKFREEKS